MEIIMNELVYAEKLLEDRRLGSHPTEILSRMAKYYMYHGKSAAEVRKLLERFVMSCDDAASVVILSDRIDSAIKYAAKHPLVIIEKIPITKSEIDAVKELEGVQLQRLAFTVLCIAKYYHECNSENMYWIQMRDSDIMKMANINTSIKRQSLMFSKLRDAGMIRFSNKVDDLGIQVLFTDEDGAPVLDIKDMRNVGYQYMKYIGGDYYTCVNCGITFKGKQKESAGRPPKYCSDCAIKIRTRQQVESVMRRRREKSGEKSA